MTKQNLKPGMKIYQPAHPEYGTFTVKFDGHNYNASAPQGSIFISNPSIWKEA